MQAARAVLGLNIPCLASSERAVASSVLHSSPGSARSYDATVRNFLCYLAASLTPRSRAWTNFAVIPHILGWDVAHAFAKAATGDRDLYRPAYRSPRRLQC